MTIEPKNTGHESSKDMPKDFSKENKFAAGDEHKEKTESQKLAVKPDFDGDSQANSKEDIAAPKLNEMSQSKPAAPQPRI